MSQRHAYDLYSDAEWEAVQQRSKPFTQQVKTLFKEDPAIPIFLGLTCFALGAGMRQSFVLRDSSKANSYMAMRVLSQAGAACALGYSIFRVSKKDQNRNEEIKQKIASQEDNNQV